MDSPGSNLFVSNTSLSAVAVCATVSLFSNLTVVPGAMLSWSGLKARALISTTVVVLLGAGALLSAGSFCPGEDVIFFCRLVELVSVAVLVSCCSWARLLALLLACWDVLGYSYGSEHQHSYS